MTKVGLGLTAKPNARWAHSATARPVRVPGTAFASSRHSPLWVPYVLARITGRANCAKSARLMGNAQMAPSPTFGANHASARTIGRGHTAARATSNAPTVHHQTIRVPVAAAHSTGRGSCALFVD